MKNLIFFLTALCLSTALSTARADTVVVQPTPLPNYGGGVPAAPPQTGANGPAIVFWDSNKLVKSSELLDLYEGEIRFGLNITKTNTPADQQVAAIVQRLRSFNPFMAQDLEKALATIQAHETFLPAGVVFVNGTDNGDNYAPLIPEGSELDDAGFYQADGSLQVSATIYNAFVTETDRAAFLIHEGIYAMAKRFSQASNSEDSRKFVAYLFAGADLTQLNDILPEFTWGWDTQFDLPVQLTESADNITVHVTSDGSSPTNVEFFCVDERFNALAAWTSGNINSGDFEVSFPYTLPDGQNCDAIRVGANDGANFKIVTSYGNQVIGQTPDPRSSDTMTMAIPIYFGN
jgi:hypothetical protein